MSIQVPYDADHRYVRNRPYADIYCYSPTNPNLPPEHLAVLIDTGADYLELPTGVATRLHINLAAHQSIPVLTAGGYVPVTLVPNFEVEIEKKRVRVMAHFLAISTGLLGLDAILTAVDFGFDTTRWLYKK
jgi:predicted aspartyl protease